jgi:predicted HicB family RNase H-like nuclease
MGKEAKQPARKPKKQRTFLVALRVSEVEHRLIAEQAQEQGKTISSILRENLGLDLGRQSKAGRGRLGKGKAA